MSQLLEIVQLFRYAEAPQGLRRLFPRQRGLFLATVPNKILVEEADGVQWLLDVLKSGDVRVLRRYMKKTSFTVFLVGATDAVQDRQ